MDFKKEIRELRKQIQFEKDSGGELELTSWNMEEGIIVSVNNLEKLLNLCEGKLSDTDSNCNIQHVVKSVCECITSDQDSDHECCRNCGKFLYQED